IFEKMQSGIFGCIKVLINQYKNMKKITRDLLSKQNKILWGTVLFLLFFLVVNTKTYSQCAVVTTNLYENFDTTTAGSTSTPSLPSCWSFIDDITTTGYLYTNDLATSAPFSGANYLRMYRTNSATNASQELVFISPETNNLGNGTKQVRFY